MKRPCACSIAAWRASAGPPLRSWRISLTRGSCAAWLSTIAAVWSVEQSSAINSSQSVMVWAWTEAMVSPISGATFHDGVMIETSGMEKPFNPRGVGSAIAESREAAKVSSCSGSLI